MSDQQPPAGGPGESSGEPQQWPRRFDPQTGEPLPQPSDPNTQFLDYRPSQVPGAPVPPVAPGAPADEGPQGFQGHPAPQAPQPQANPWRGESQHNEGQGGSPWLAQGSGTDALGRTVWPAPPPPKRNRLKLIGGGVLALALVGGVATGTFFLLDNDDEQSTVAGGTSSTSPSPSGSTTPSPSPSDTPSPSSTESSGSTSTESPSGPSTSSSPGTAPASPTPPKPTPPSPTPPKPVAPKPPAATGPDGKLLTYGARIDVGEFNNTWKYRYGDVELDMSAVSAANHPTCRPVAQGPDLAKAGCVFAGETVQENVQDQVRVTSFVLEFKNPKQAAAAEKSLTDVDFNLAAGGRTLKKPVKGMWRAFDADEYLVFSVATTTDKKLDDRLLNRYAGYRSADLAGAIRFM